MKKLIIISIFIFSILSLNNSLAVTCNPCGTDWTPHDLGVWFGYKDCMGNSVEFSTQICNGKCYFRIDKIYSIADCLWNHYHGFYSEILEAACKAIIKDTWDRWCWPDGPNECTENIESWQSGCWKWNGPITPGGNGYELVPCDQNSCCETHWMLCTDENGKILDPYITYQTLSDPCTDPLPEGCATACPEIH